MVDMSLLPERRALTRADLDSLPDDGHRYELVDGSLIVTPAPSRQHQLAVSRLMHVLQLARPAHQLVLAAPTDVTLADDTTLQPDLLVVDQTGFLDESRPLSPLLVVEVLSPSTRQIDLTLKKARYEAAATPAYWVVDTAAPSVTAWTRVSGRYGEPLVAVGTDLLQVTAPFEVAISPSQLVL